MFRFLIRINVLGTDLTRYNYEYINNDDICLRYFLAAFEQIFVYIPRLEFILLLPMQQKAPYIIHIQVVFLGAN